MYTILFYLFVTEWNEINNIKNMFTFINKANDMNDKILYLFKKIKLFKPTKSSFLVWLTQCILYRILSECTNALSKGFGKYAKTLCK